MDFSAGRGEHFFDTMPIAKSLTGFLHRWRRWLIASALLGLAVLAIWLVIRPQRYRITDVTKPQAIVLKAPSNEKHRWIDISLRISGKVDGTATIHFPFRASSIEVKDSFDLDLGVQDCYSPEFPLEYIPQAVTKGRVTIYYKFYDADMSFIRSKLIH